MNEIGLPTAEEVIAAYRKTGLTPTTMRADASTGSCCAIGAIGAAAGLKLFEYPTLTQFARQAGITGDVLKFALGFDGAGASIIDNGDQAWRHGKLVRKACTRVFGPF